MDDAVPTDQIEEVVMPVLRDHGLELVDIEWRPRRPRGVGIGDCERVSRELGDVLDAAATATLDASYDLEVSSPGLDRLLRKEREFRWAVGRQLCCWLAGGREVRGQLVAVEPDRLVIEHDGERVELSRAGLTKVRLEAEVRWTRRA